METVLHSLPNLSVTTYTSYESQRILLVSCVDNVEDAIAIITYISYKLDKQDVPQSARHWQAVSINDYGKTEIQVRLERLF